MNRADAFNSSSLVNNNKKTEPDINEYKSQLNNLMIENSSYRHQINIFKEEVNKYKKIIFQMKDNCPDENRGVLIKFLSQNNVELEEVMRDLDKVIDEAEKDYTKVCIQFDNKYGDDNSETNQIENQLFLLNNLFFSKEREILYLETLYNSIAQPNINLAFEYYDIDPRIINQTLSINLNELRGSYASLSKQIINMKQKNEKTLNHIKVIFIYIIF